jgi:8-oxo-dGTP diphosphatase
MRNVYEVVWGMPLDPRNFSLKVAQTERFVEATGTNAHQKWGAYRGGAFTGVARRRPLFPRLLRNGAAS